MDESRYREAERALWSKFGLRPFERVLPLPRLGSDVRVLETGDGPPVVFVHGVSNGAASWAALAGQLAGFRCILVDRPGCGLSPPGPRHADMAHLAAFADQLFVDVLDALSIERAHVIGTSFGGYFVLRAAAVRPDRVDRLVTLGWSFGAEVTKAPLALRIGSLPPLRRLSTKIPLNERTVRVLLRQIGLRGALESGRFGPEEMGWFLSLLRDTDTMRNEIDAAPPVVTVRGFNDETKFDPAVLASISAPTLMLWGTDDPTGNEAVARSFVAQVPSATLQLLPGFGHAPWIDDPELVAARILRFLGNS